MAAKVFSSVVIGSTATEMKIFELSPRRGMRQIDFVSYPINLGVDAYTDGRLNMKKVDEANRRVIDYVLKK